MVHRAVVGSIVFGQRVIATGALLFVSLAAGVLVAQRPASQVFFAAHAAIEEYFESLPDYEAGDLITQSLVAEALAKAAASGVEVPGAEHLIERALPDNSFLARELSTPAGRKFMRKVARHRGAFSRLDRLSSIARGQAIVRDLVRNPDGDKLIEYLATTRSGRKLGRSLAGAQQGADLNKPTGRIYTADDLLDELRRLLASGGNSLDQPDSFP